MMATERLAFLQPYESRIFPIFNLKAPVDFLLFCHRDPGSEFESTRTHMVRAWCILEVGWAILAIHEKPQVTSMNLPTSLHRNHCRMMSRPPSQHLPLLPSLSWRSLLLKSQLISLSYSSKELFPPSHRTWREIRLPIVISFESGSQFHPCRYMAGFLIRPDCIRKQDQNTGERQQDELQ